MLVNIQIPDEVYQKYAERRPDRPQAAIAETLKEFVNHTPGEPRLIIEGEAVRRLNTILGWPVDRTETLLEMINKLRNISVAGLEIELTPDQLTRLRAQTNFYTKPGDDLEEAFRAQVVARIKMAIAGLVG